MRIAVDVMGGDHAPDAILAGCLAALPLLGADDQLVLIGDQSTIEKAITEAGVNDARLVIDPTTEVIGMAESPVNALRNKPNSSIARMGYLGGRKSKPEEHCEIVISAGNTGACVAACQMAMRRLPGVHRPGVAVTIPTVTGAIIVCDVGANPEPKPSHLHQYGHMASVYAQRVIGVENPRVALMSIGGEEGKGNTLVRETHTLMKGDSSLNYCGYIEGREIFNGKADVIITEGFTGNVVLKLAEGMAAGLFKMIAKEIMAIDPQLAVKFEPVVKSIYKKHDYHEYGGAPLLGANGVGIIAHGSSESRTITNAIRNAMTYASRGVNEGIIEALSRFEIADV